MWLHVLQTLPPLAVSTHQAVTIDLTSGIHFGWVNQGSVEYEVWPKLLHMASTGNQTPDLLIGSPTQYPLGYMLPKIKIKLPT